MQKKRKQFAKFIISIAVSVFLIMGQAIPTSFADNNNFNERLSLSQTDAGRQFMPPNPETYPEFYQKEDNSVKEDFFEEDEADGFYSAEDDTDISSVQFSSEGPRRDLVSKRSSDFSIGSTEKVLVIPIAFSNLVFNENHNAVYYQNLMDQLKDYYEKNSQYLSGVQGVTIDATIADPVTSTAAAIFYGQDSNTDKGYIDDVNPVEELAREAVHKLDETGFDFSPFDQNGDGTIDHIIIIHPGYGQEEVDNSDLIWSHSSENSEIIN